MNWILLIAISITAFLSVAALCVGLIPALRERVQNYFGGVQRTSEALENMFMILPKRKLMMLYTLSPVGVALVLYILMPKLYVIPVGMALGALIPRFFVKFMESSRQNKFRGQLVDALMVLTGALKAGLSILQSLEVLVEESTAPMSEEIGLVLKETRMGMALDESLKRLNKRMPMNEVNLIITALLVARETGGDITTVFTQLVETIRERHKLRERLKTLTVIPRLQGWIMAAIPIVFGSFVTGINPTYFEKLTQDPVGQILIVVAAGMWGVSLFMIMIFSKSPI